MTGQVKEDLLSRFGELGVFVEEGKVVFKPRLLKTSEFLSESSIFEYIDVNSQKQQLNIKQNQLCFTYCQIPIIYTLSDNKSVEVVFNDDKKIGFSNLSLSQEVSNKMFNRTNEINHINVSIIK